MTRFNFRSGTWTSNIVSFFVLLRHLKGKTPNPHPHAEIAPLPDQALTYCALFLSCPIFCVIPATDRNRTHSTALAHVLPPCCVLWNVGKSTAVTAKYGAAASALGSVNHLSILHLDPTTKAFLDWGLHTEAVELVEPQALQDPNNPNSEPDLVRVVREEPKMQLVPAFGYVSLFPLMMELFPVNSEHLGDQLNLLQKEELLWTSYGLRSLATTSSIYMK
jgi:hypothetical protein